MAWKHCGIPQNTADTIASCTARGTKLISANTCSVRITINFVWIKIADLSEEVECHIVEINPLAFFVSITQRCDNNIEKLLTECCENDKLHGYVSESLKN